MMRALVAAWIAGLAAAVTATAQAQPAGSITVYTSQPTEQMSAVIDLFHKDYPKVSIRLYRSGTTEVMNKLQAEFVAGQAQADVVLLADAVAMTRLKSDGRLMRYDAAPVKSLPASVVDQDRTFFGTKLITTGIVYNTRLVTKAPKSWRDLAAPAVAAQTIMPSPLYSGAATIFVGAMVQHPEFGWTYFRTLAQHGAVAAQGNGAVIDAVARGEKAYGVIVDYMAFNAHAKGSPVDFAFPKEGVTAVTQPVAILKDAHNLEAAKAFVDWQLSRAAQQQSATQGYYPILSDVPAPKNYPALSSLKFMSADYRRILADDQKNKRQFADLFGG